MEELNKKQQEEKKPARISNETLDTLQDIDEKLEFNKED